MLRPYKGASEQVRPVQVTSLLECSAYGSWLFLMEQPNMSNGNRTSRRNSNRTFGLLESLEGRTMFSGVDQSVGTLEGRFFQQGHVFGSDTDAYHFHVSQAGTIDVQ